MPELFLGFIVGSVVLYFVLHSKIKPDKVVKTVIKDAPEGRVACRSCRSHRLAYSSPNPDGNCDHSSNIRKLFDPISGYSYEYKKSCVELNPTGECKNYEER